MLGGIDQIAQEDRANDAPSIGVKRHLFRHFLKKKKYQAHYFWYALSRWILSDEVVEIFKSNFYAQRYRPSNLISDQIDGTNDIHSSFTQIPDVCHSVAKPTDDN